MTSFTGEVANNVTAWVGDPDCQAVHDALLEWLRDTCSSFLPATSPYTSAIQGNLGESLAFVVGQENGFGEYRADCANALTPFLGISKPEVDIVWLSLSEDPSLDHVVLQEVKTTIQARLDYADTLLDDYDKLFGSDLTVTLQSRLSAIAARLRYGGGSRGDLADRVVALSGESAATSQGVRLLPTVVHDRGVEGAQTKLIAVREGVIGQGWSAHYVSAWSIALSDLNARLRRVAVGEP